MRLAILTLLALTGLVVGFWAAVLPESFYGDFPVIRPSWVSLDGPYNEHLVRDVGSMFLALGAVTVGAIVVRTTTAARLAGVAWLVFSVPHAIYHLAHLHVFPPLDQVLNAVALPGLALLALAVVVLPEKISTAGDRARSRVL
ncbi:hypothetical protein GCM10017786_55940 [Amycolatopsis deserti]|uniref:Uncharacterized protein n=1 Tax=Amycolatopsis deserti TaxID=185696 RepID=A0ABQ3JGC3_9PSEU|nr:hypothetical protein [Amycolatopsis deserti]GHF15001.1 hypothetical protein GCM10017786_55940 [Amycolatopsis deserti]